MKGISLFTRSAACLSALPLASCAVALPRAAEPGDRFCYRVSETKRIWHPCTTTPILGDAAEADAKRFEAKPDVATLHVGRNRWADTINRVGQH